MRITNERFFKPSPPTSHFTSCVPSNRYRFIHILLFFHEFSPIYTNDDFSNVSTVKCGKHHLYVVRTLVCFRRWFWTKHTSKHFLNRHRSQSVFAIERWTFKKCLCANPSLTIPIETYQKWFSYFWWLRIGFFKLRQCKNVAYNQLAVNNVKENRIVSVEIVRLCEWIPIHRLCNCGDLCVCSRWTISMVRDIRGCSENSRMKEEKRKINRKISFKFREIINVSSPVISSTFHDGRYLKKIHIVSK